MSAGLLQHYWYKVPVLYIGMYHWMGHGNVTLLMDVAFVTPLKIAALLGAPSA